MAAALQVPTIVLVPSRALFDQWSRRAVGEMGMRPTDVGAVQGKIRKLRPLTIAMQPTLARGVDEKMRRYFGALIYDEVQLAAAPTCFAAIDPFPAKYRIGISADERRKDRKECLTRDLFGEVACDVDKGRLIAEGAILDVEVRVVPTEFAAPWYGLPDEAAETEIDTNRLLDEMAADDARCAILHDVIKQERDLGEQVIVMTHRREFCRQIDLVVTQREDVSGFLIGGEDFRLEFTRTRERFERGEVGVAIGTFKAIGYAIDIPRAGVVVCATPVLSRQQFGQVWGRACRPFPGKKPRLYVLWDKAVFGDYLKKLVAWNRSVVVRDGDRWVKGRDYVRAARAA
jgi:superfamily II DNA or RNA helicase